MAQPAEIAFTISIEFEREQGSFSKASSMGISFLNTGMRRIVMLAVVFFRLVNTLADNLDEWTLQGLQPLGKIANSSDRLVAVGSLGNILVSTNVTDWTIAPGNPLAGDSQTAFWNIAFGNDRFVAAGYQFVPGSAEGIILTSSDGFQWTLTRIVTNTLYGINFANGQFLAVGKKGFMLSSTDGINWEQRATGTTNDLYGAGFGNANFVAVGDYTIIASSDGLNWNNRSPSGAGWLKSVAYGQGRLVAVSRTSPNVWTSADAMNWFQGSLPWTNTYLHPELTSINYAHSTFFCVGNAQNCCGSSQGILFTSADGLTWAQRPSTTTAQWSSIYWPSIITERWSDSILWNDTFIVVGDGIIQSQPFSGPKRPPRLLVDPKSKIALSNASVSLSVTGASWPPLSFQWRLDGQPIVGKTNSSLSFVATMTNAGDYTLVATNAIGSVTSSPAVVTVVNRITPVQSATMPVTMGGTFTLGVTASSNSTLAFQWRANKSDMPNETNSILMVTNALLTQPTYDVIVTNFAGAVTNPPISVAVEPYSEHPLYRWQNRSPSDLAGVLSYPPNGAQGGLSGVTFGNGIFVAVGAIALSDFGAILSSTDGTKWTRHQPPLGQQYGLPLSLYDVAFGNGTFVAVGYSSSIYSSTNGADWSQRMLGAYGTSLSRVVFRSGYFWATGGQTLRSTNGISWQSWPSSPGYSDLPVLAAGMYVTVSNSPSGLYVSTNGVNWSLAYASDYGLSDVTFGNGTFVAVGGNGTIIQSAPLAQIAWDSLSPGQLAIRGLVGRQYQIDHRSSLFQSDSWSPLSTFALTNNPVLIPVGLTSPLTNRFFRSALLP